MDYFIIFLETKRAQLDFPHETNILDEKIADLRGILQKKKKIYKQLKQICLLKHTFRKGTHRKNIALIQIIIKIMLFSAVFLVEYFLQIIHGSVYWR